MLAQPDELDRQIEFVLDGHHHSAPRGAVELGDDQPRQRDELVEFSRLVQRVHPGGGIDHEQRFVRRAIDLVADHAVQFLEFAHQVVLGMESAGGVDE